MTIVMMDDNKVRVEHFPFKLSEEEVNEYAQQFKTLEQCFIKEMQQVASEKVVGKKAQS